jgi:hypothetical protein
MGMKSRLVLPVISNLLQGTSYTLQQKIPWSYYWGFPEASGIDGTGMWKDN